MVKKAKNICAYEPCQNEVLSSRHKYCSDGHRRYAYKKTHWKKYLAWQRKYTKEKREEQKKAGV